MYIIIPIQGLKNRLKCTYLVFLQLILYLHGLKCTYLVFVQLILYFALNNNNLSFFLFIIYNNFNI